jgi:hypothetical protein
MGARRGGARCQGIAQGALRVAQPPPPRHRRTLVGGDEHQDPGQCASRPCLLSTPQLSVPSLRRICRSPPKVTDLQTGPVPAGREVVIRLLNFFCQFILEGGFSRSGPCLYLYAGYCLL